MSATSGSTTHAFVYDGDGRVMGEYGSSPSDVIAETIWLSPEVANDNQFGGDDGVGGYAPLAVATGSGASAALTWVHGNHLGVPIAFTDASGATVAAPSYSLPGFLGQTQTLSDLYYNRYRDYDSSTGRYIQADPIGLRGGENPYVYATDNPLRYGDPFGEAVCVYGISERLMVCMPDRLGLPPLEIPVASGNNVGRNCKNNPACIQIPDHGPIPTGCWEWDPKQTTTKPNGRVLKACPDTNTYNRSLFRTHSCSYAFGPSKTWPPCSAGCITGQAPDIRRLTKLIDAEPGSVLEVVP